MKSTIKIGLLICYILQIGCSITKQVSSTSYAEAKQLVDQGVNHLRSGALEKARASFLIAKEIAPLPEIFDGLGCVAFLYGDVASAELYFKHAYELDGSYYNSLGNLALLYESLGVNPEAIRLYQVALHNDPKNFQLRNNFAAFLYDYKDWQDVSGREELLKAQAVSNHPIVQLNLKRLEEMHE